MAETMSLTAGELHTIAGWKLPDRTAVGILMLILTESVLFLMFAAAYIFYVGKSPGSPTPREILTVPVISTICLLSSSFTIYKAERAIDRNQIVQFRLWFLATLALGVEFLTATGVEWRHLIVHQHFTVRTNVFGTSFYSLVGLHASHVSVGVLLMLAVLLASLLGLSMAQQARRVRYLAWYWHFVDAVWVVVFSVVYILGR